MKMKRMICAFLLMTALLLANVTPVFAAEEGKLPSGIAYDEIGAAVEAIVEEYEDTTAGLAAGVFDRDGILYEGYFGYANKETGLDVDAETVMEWGSISKLTVWVSVMQLWEQGRIDLNKDIQIYLPDGFLKNLCYEKPITMMDLMNHTPGFEEFVFGLVADDEESLLPLEETLSRFQPVQRFEPGVVQAYSNYGTALAGYIVERISGQPYYAYVREHIFEPLDMRHTSILSDMSDNPWVQTQREKLHCYRDDCSYIPDGRWYLNLYPCAMCISPLEDLIKFGQALLDPNSPLFESSTTYAEMFSPSAYCGDTDIPACCHGFWPVFGKPNLLYHMGTTAGCSSVLYLDLNSGTAVAVMTNQRFEYNYVYSLPELVFSESEDADGSNEQEDVEEYSPFDSGYAENSRNIWTGPLKLYRLFNTVSLSDYYDWGNETESFGVSRVVYPGLTLLSAPTTSVILRFASVILWALASLFSLFLLFARLVQTLRHRQKKAMGVWGFLCCIVQLPFPLVMLPLAQSLQNLEWWPMWCYRLVFIVAFILCLVMVALFVLGILRSRKEALSKKQKALHVILLITLLISILNILYWNLFMFWMIP